ncbi:ChaN family lipoprotein [Candidatus Uabimicrobium amorphum]|uniref:Haem-binding uptake Tiki superfamily ChaN domain-containing protein n=1 Tax=Uabimicrobium amorphum TaxID=2596890 RepID=A0A5S9F205_UABAM|nr:ChaN family lipoprotein [Candidatus Uabimicrobium amorphum]BBM81874.1 hypothetical protein UABAM_00216 [Candidatus Uabimicrobium amorphum]
MKTFALLLSLLFITNCTFAEKKWPKIYDTNSNKWIALEEVEEILQKHRVVFVGEKHGHRWGHRIERMLLEMYWNVRGDVAVAMEMFERDTQHILDGYVRGEIDEKFLLRNTRPWKNYKTDYRPLVEFAKDMSLPVLAMNAPRRYASFVAKNKEEILFAMPNKEQTFMAQKITAPQDRYFEKFQQAMRGMPKSMISSYYRAQCFKDDTMAKSMAVFMMTNRRTSIIAYMGSFHCDERLGTVQRFSAMVPRVKSLVVSIVPTKGDKIENIDTYKPLGDLIFFAPENPNQSKQKTPAVHPHMKGKTNPHTKGKMPNPHTKGKMPNPHTKGKMPNPHTKEKMPNPHTKEKMPNPHQEKVPVHPNVEEQSKNPHEEKATAHAKVEKTPNPHEEKAAEEKTADHPHEEKATDEKAVDHPHEEKTAEEKAADHSHEEKAAEEKSSDANVEESIEQEDKSAPQDNREKSDESEESQDKDNIG